LPLHVIYGPSQKCEEVRGGQTRYANRVLCLICAVFWTTPTEALEIEDSISPIRIQVQLQAKRYAVRLNKLPLTNPVIQRLPNTWRNGNPPTHLVHLLLCAKTLLMAHRPEFYPHGAHDDEGDPNDHAQWRRSPSPASSVSNLAASFVQLIHNFVCRAGGRGGEGTGS
jgi:hypothetical protein